MTLEQHLDSVREFKKRAPAAQPGEFERLREEDRKSSRSLGIMLGIAGAAGVLWQIWGSL